MLNLLLAATLIAAPPLQDPPPPEKTKGPDPALVEEAKAGLEEAFKKGKAADRITALTKYGKVNDAEVIALIGRGLRDRENTVRNASIASLRWLKHPDALDQLHKSLTKDRAMKKDDQLHEAMLKAIGQHGSPKSIEILADGALAEAPRKVHAARIYSLGNIRDKAAVDELFSIMQRGIRRGGKHGGERHPQINELQTSLQMLTGQKLGSDPRAWIDWWKDNERDFEVSAAPVDVPPKTMKQWNKYWGLEKKKDPKEKRRRKQGEGEGGDEG